MGLWPRKKERNVNGSTFLNHEFFTFEYNIYNMRILYKNSLYYIYIFFDWKQFSFNHPKMEENKAQIHSRLIETQLHRAETNKTQQKTQQYYPSFPRSLAAFPVSED